MNATQPHLDRAMLVLALCGAGISAYLTATHWAEQPVICAGLGSCAAVQSSAYARVAGAPVAVLGLGLYGAISVLLLASARLWWASIAVFGLALSGALYSGYLTWVELAVLEALCLWCVASAVVITTLAALSLWATVRTPVYVARPNKRRAA
jgi:uncharacterized membrane protein